MRASGWQQHGDQFIVSAGTVWDEFVAAMVAEGRRWIEALSGIPGSVGATPIQNVGAYGQEVAGSIAGLRVLDRATGEITTRPAPRAQFGYRDSTFKRHPADHVVPPSPSTFRWGPAPDRVCGVGPTLGGTWAHRCPWLRCALPCPIYGAGRGWFSTPRIPIPAASVSFFTNPIVEAVPDGAPGWPQPDGRHKTSAAWLIENAGVHKGSGFPGPTWRCPRSTPWR